MTDALRDQITDLLDRLPDIHDPRMLLAEGGRITSQLENLPPARRAAYEEDMRRLIAALESHIFSLEQQLKDQQT